MIYYNKEFLTKFCNDNEIVLSEEYLLVNRETVIKGICKTINCNELFNKTFRRLVEINNLCKKCTSHNGKIKRINTNLKKFGTSCPLQNTDVKNKTKATNYEKYGCEYPSQNDNVKNTIKQTNLIKYGVEYSLQNEDVRNKIKSTNLERYGFEIPVQNEDIKNKMKTTNLVKYGVNCPFQNEDVKNTIKETNLTKYGVENVFQNEDIKNKSKQTNLTKYGVEYPSQNEDVKNKMKTTNLERYGVENAAQNEDIKLKIKATNLIKYGCDHANQCAYIFDDKPYSNTNTNKIYTFKSGNIIKIQGYENFALDILINLYDENEILNKRADMPKLNYEKNKKKHIYFPDFFIPKDNLIIEVKSFYTYKLNLITNILKAHCVRKLNYNYEIWIFDNKRNLTII